MPFPSVSLLKRTLLPALLSSSKITLLITSLSLSLALSLSFSFSLSFISVSLSLALPRPQIPNSTAFAYNSVFKLVGQLFPYLTNKFCQVLIGLSPHFILLSLFLLRLAPFSLRISLQCFGINSLPLNHYQCFSFDY
jgi:hypothetical protein